MKKEKDRTVEKYDRIITYLEKTNNNKYTDDIIQILKQERDSYNYKTGKRYNK